MMNKLIRIILVLALSFQLVIPAGGEDDYTDFFSDFGQEVSDKAKEKADKFAETGKKVVDAYGNIVGYVVDGAGTVVDTTGKVIGKVVDTAGTVVDKVGNAIGTAWNWVTGKGNEEPDNTPPPNTGDFFDKEIEGGEEEPVDGDFEEPPPDEEPDEVIQKDDDKNKDDKNKDDKKKDDKKKDDKKKDDKKKDDKKTDNQPTDDKKKDDGPGVFDKLKDLVKTVAGLWAAGKIEKALELLAKIKKAIELLDKASDIKDLYDDINDLVDQLKENYDNDPNLTESEKEILKDCADDIGDILKEGGDDMDEKLEEVINETGDKLKAEEAKETAKENNTNGDPATDDPRINNLLDIINDESKSDEEREAAAKELAQVLEEDGYDQETVDEANELADKIAEGAAELGDALLDLATDIAISKARDELGKYIGKENAEKIADYAQKVADGEMSLEEAINEGLGDLINNVLPPGTADAAMEFFNTIAEGDGFGEFTGSLDDLLQAAAKDGVASLVAESGLSKEQQEKVMEAVENACNGDWEKVWDDAKEGVGDYLGDVVSDLFGEEAGNAAKDIINGILNGDESFINNGVDAATTLLSSELEKKIGAQLDKLAEKYPLLGQIFDALGLDGGSIMEGIANCWNAIKDGKLAEMMSDLISKIADAINNLVEKLKNFIQDFVSNLINTITDFVTGLINDLVDAVTSVVKAALGSFVQSINNLKNQLADASGYFLGNDGGSGATLIDKNNQPNNTQQKNVFKSQGGN